jgi:hypothetical protein
VTVLLRIAHLCADHLDQAERVVRKAERVPGADEPSEDASLGVDGAAVAGRREAGVGAVGTSASSRDRASAAAAAAKQVVARVAALVEGAAREGGSSECCVFICRAIITPTSRTFANRGGKGEPRSQGITVC